MKLAEALILRVDLQKQIRQLEARMTRNAKVQEGDAPAENPQELLVDYENSIAQWGDLLKRINTTNCFTKTEDGLTVTDWLAQRDMLKERVRFLRQLIDVGTIQFDRFTRSEIKQKSVVNITELQSKLDRLSKEFRELDTKIQALNWNIDLI